MKPLITKGAEQRRLAEEVANRTKASVAELLLTESARYRRLAETKALELVLTPVAEGDRIVLQHLVRAETFKAAAALVAGGAR